MPAAGRARSPGARSFGAGGSSCAARVGERDHAGCGDVHPRADLGRIRLGQHLEALAVVAFDQEERSRTGVAALAHCPRDAVAIEAEPLGPHHDDARAGARAVPAERPARGGARRPAPPPPAAGGEGGWPRGARTTTTLALVPVPFPPSARAA